MKCSEEITFGEVDGYTFGRVDESRKCRYGKTDTKGRVDMVIGRLQEKNHGKHKVNGKEQNRIPVEEEGRQ